MSDKKQRVYHVKVKINVVGYKNAFLSGMVIAKRPKQAKEAAEEFIYESIRNDHSDADVTATKVDYIRQDFSINTLKNIYE